MQSDRDLLKQALEWFTDCYQHSGLTAARWGMEAMRERLAQPEFDDALQSAATTQTTPKLEQPEHWEQFYPDMGKPLDRMAENARELGLDYEPVDTKVNFEAIPEQISEPVAMRYDFDGYGYRYIDSGSGSNWQTRIKDAEPLYAAPQQSDTKVNFEEIPKQISEPVAWDVINPAGEVVATEKDAIHGWARLGGFKPTVEGLMGFHDQGWRVVPSTTPTRREWVGLTAQEAADCWSTSATKTWQAVEAKLKEKNA